MSEAVRAIDQLDALIDVLGEDVGLCLRALRDDDTQSTRRQLVRAIFAQIEGTVFAMKQIALGRQVDTRDVLEAGEVALILEQTYDLTDQGKLKTRPANLPFANNLRFAFDVFVRSYHNSYQLPVGENGWESLKVSSRVRNRLMHPKSTSDLTVTDEEMLQLREAHEWFLKCRNAAVKAAIAESGPRSRAV